MLGGSDTTATSWPSMTPKQTSAFSHSSHISQTLSPLVNPLWPNQPPVHPCDGPIINHAITTILPSTPSLARQSAQHRHFTLVFVAAVEAEEPSFTRLAAIVWRRRYDTALDSRHSTRTHTTTNQKQSAVMEGRRERRCGHRGGEDLSFWRREEDIK